MVTYRVDPVNRVVAAVLTVSEGEKGYPGELVSSLLEKHGVAMYFTRELEFSSQERYVGIARAHPEDKWDAETGKRIALFRATRQFTAAKLKFLWKWRNRLSEVFTAVLSRLDRQIEASVRNMEDLKCQISRF